MITVNQTPAPGAKIMDANDTVISITSSNGAGFYFRAEISINDTLFDVQSWSREDGYTATVNLRQFYQKYFTLSFVSSFTSGLAIPTNVSRKVSIMVKEYDLGDDTLVQAKALPDFFIYYNQSPMAFNYTNPISVLTPVGFVRRIPDNGKLVVCFFANVNNQTLSVVLRDSNNQLIDQKNISAALYSEMLVYRYDLSQNTIPDDVTYFTVTISHGSHSQSIFYKRIVKPVYPVREIAYLSGVGIWNYAYFTGLMNTDVNAEVINYQDQDGITRNAEVNTNLQISLNSGVLRNEERHLADEIIQALEARFFLNNEWREISQTTKKIQQFRDRQYNYGEAFVFTVLENPPLSNSNLVSIAAESSDGMSRLQLDSVTNLLGDLTINFTKLFGYNPDVITVLLYQGSTLITSQTGSAVSPRTLTGVAPGTYTVYLQEVDTGMLSNAVMVTVEEEVPAESSDGMARLEITNVTEAGGIITISFIKEAGYNPTQVNILIVRESDGTTVTNINAPATSPRMIFASFNDNYIAYLREIETGNISVGFPFTVTESQLS